MATNNLTELQLDNLKIALDLLGDQIIIDIISKLRQLDAVSSGKLLNSLNYRVVEVLDTVILVLEAEEYIQVIDKGRRPGKMPPLSAILTWVRIKGLPKEAAFPIARNIGKFGIKPRPFLNEIISNNTKIAVDLLEDGFKKDVEKLLKTIITKVENS